MKVVLLLAAVLPLLFAACDDDENSARRLPADEPIIRLGEQPFADHGTVDVRGEEQLRMAVDSFHFAPTFIRGAPGQTLTLEIRSDDQRNRHSFTMAEIDREIPPGGAERIQITFPASGIQLFFCRYHVEQGMRGELLVGDASPQPAP